MTSIATFPSVPDVQTGGISMIDGAVVAAGGTVSGSRATGIFGIESAAGANAAGLVAEPVSFESNLNSEMESLRSGVDGSTEDRQAEEKALPSLSMGTGKESIAHPGSGIRVAQGERADEVPMLEAIRNRIDCGIIRTATGRANSRTAQAARHSQCVPRTQADAEEKSGLTGTSGNSVTEVSPAASDFWMTPSGPDTAGRQGHRTQEGFGTSLDAPRGRDYPEPRLQAENVLRGSADSNLLKGMVAANGTGISQDGSNPIAVPDQAFPDRLMMRTEKNRVETAGGESLVQTVPAAHLSAVAREPGRAAASASTESIETQDPSLHSLTRQAALKGAPAQDVNGRPARHAPRAEAGEMDREKAFAGQAAQQGMDPGRIREAATAGGLVEQRAYNLTEAVRQSPSVSNGPAGNNPFSALDADQAAGSTHWIHAGAHRAEAGYLDPALGWVSVRAEAVNGGIHAAVMPGSPEAAHVLGGHMTGLSSHLAQQHGNTATVTLDSAPDGRDGLGSGSQAGGGDRGGERQPAGGGNETRHTVMTDLPVRRMHPGSGATTTNVLVPERSGSTISVIA